MKRTSLTLLVPTAFVLALAFAPAAGAQATAKVTCKDGTTSTATGRGACSAHGGVATAAATKAADKAAAKSEKATSKAATKAEKAADKTTKTAEKAASKTAKATEKAAAKTVKAADKAEAKTTIAASGDVTAKCKDGTTSKAKNHRGACSGHGGVETWLKP